MTHKVINCTPCMENHWAYRRKGEHHSTYMSILYSSNGKTHCIQGPNNDKVPKPKRKKGYGGHGTMVGSKSKVNGTSAPKSVQKRHCYAIDPEPGDAIGLVSSGMFPPSGASFVVVSIAVIVVCDALSKPMADMSTSQVGKFWRNGTKDRPMVS
jgi:hypothetical protein